MAGKTRTLAPLNDSNRFDTPSLQSYQIKSPTSRKVSEAADPLLSDLSPAAVLDVLRNNGTSSSISGSRERVLVDSIAEASQHERALGIRAALIGKRMKDWITELQSWEWPQNSFQPPINDTQDIFWGALPSREVMKKEQRLERIKDDMSILEVEELKNYVRNIHLQPQSRRTSGNSQVSLSSSQYHRLDDFSVLITAVIVQALPDLATLTRLLSNWSVRLLVLKQIPGFLGQLQDTRVALESAWATLDQILNPGASLSLTESTYQQIRKILEDRITDLARRIDAILDALEGNEDSIPDGWIDDMEDAETDYKNWVVEAEKFVKLHEWQASKAHDAGNLVPLVSSIQQNAPISEEVDQTQGDDIHGDQLQEPKGMLTGGEEVLGITKDDGITSRDEAKQVSVTPLQDGTIPETSNNLPTSHTPETPSRSQRSQQDQGDESPKVPTYIERTIPISMTTPVRHPARKPAPLTLDTSRTTFDEGPKSHISSISMASSTGFTDMSSPQIFDASEIQYFKSPMDDQFPPIFTKDAEDIPSPTSTGYSASNRFKHGRSVSAIEPMTRSRASSLHSQATVVASEREERFSESIEEKLNIMIAIKDQDKEAEGMSYDTPPSPSITDIPPILNVRKARQPVEQSNASKISAAGKVGNGSTAKQMEDKMTAKITRLLTKIPAPIKLANHPADSEFESGSDPKLHNQARQQRSVTPALTLSPVTSKAKNTPTNDSGVRVYHLHQPGRDAPIKLFIRLVGSEERVMVRVGGGWADLAEYLKEYAMHHGRRSVSSNNFELKGLPPAQNAATSLFDINRSSATSSVAGTPNSKVATPANKIGPSNTAQTPEPKSDPNIISSTESIGFHPASSASLFPTNTYEPSSSPSSSPSPSPFVGLAGPKIKNVELSSQKKAWVDGMLSQARNISSEHHHKKVVVDEIGDLGKVGNTKRIFLKGRVDGE